VVSNNVVIFPSVLKSLPFDMPGDFTPIAVVGATPMVLVVNPAKVQATNHKEFQALLKAKPGSYNFASGGNGTILHLATELFLDEAGVTAKHIPYKGVGPMVTDLIGGQVDFGTAALPSVQAHIKSGALRPIGMLSPQRTPAAPEIPTFAEQGLANFSVEAWFAVIGPRRRTWCWNEGPGGGQAGLVSLSPGCPPRSAPRRPAAPRWPARGTARCPGSPCPRRRCRSTPRRPCPRAASASPSPAARR
jgi:hypothetical protein